MQKFKQIAIKEASTPAVILVSYSVHASLFVIYTKHTHVYSEFTICKSKTQKLYNVPIGKSRMWW